MGQVFVLRGSLGSVGALQDQTAVSVGYDDPDIRGPVDLQRSVISAGTVGYVSGVQILMVGFGSARDVDVVSARLLVLLERPHLCVVPVGYALEADVVVLLASLAAVGVGITGLGGQEIMVVRLDIVVPVGDLIIAGGGRSGIIAAARIVRRVAAVVLGDVVSVGVIVGKVQLFVAVDGDNKTLALDGCAGTIVLSVAHAPGRHVIETDLLGLSARVLHL